MQTSKCVKHIAQGSIFSSLIVLSPVLLASGYELSVQAGSISSDSEGTQYALNNVSNSVQEGDLEDGNQFRINLGKELAGFKFNVGYGQNTLSGKSTYDTNPGAPNDCNVAPLQGTYNDCFDHANIKIDTDFGVFDAAVGKSFVMGSTNIEPYAGLRYLTVSQEIGVDYVYPGGSESFPNREIDYSGFGLRIGSRLNVPFGASPFFFRGDLALAKMLSGDREQTITDRVTGGPATPAPFSVEDSVKPLTIDLELFFGYKIRENMSAGIGYGYHKISEILDTRDTVNPVTPGTISGAVGVGSANADLVTSGLFAEFNYKF
jgi:hypothetical protein